MSLHRVLPVPLALSDKNLAQRWDVVPDSFEGSRTMSDRNSSSAHFHSPRVSTPTPRPSSSSADIRHSSSPPDSSEDYRSPSIPRPTAAASKRRGDIPWEQGDSHPEQEYPASVCLCQPDPKVPRPRNAFILYRQHYQASVVSQNPGLANPQISKVIGDHWQAEPEEVKNHWRVLAEEEKARHQKQHPGYRYQPRKSNRTNSVSSTLPVTDDANLSLTRCAKCGGRSMSSAAIMSATAAGNNHQSNHAHRSSAAVAYSPSRALAASSLSAGSNRFARGLGSPPSAQVLPQGHRYHPHQSKPYPATSPHSKRPELHEATQHSPDAKRRRMVNPVAFVPVRGLTGPLSPLSFPARHQRRESLPRLDSMGPSSLHSPFTMGPPPRHQAALSRTETGLTLAPLQQANGNTAGNGTDTQAKSLEAMILSIPILNKIKVLARISAPLAASPPSSPTAPITATASTASAAASRDQTGKRGLVIAIDAADPVALKQLTRALAHALDEHDVKIIATPRPPKDTEPSFQNYLRLIDQYHTLSARIKDHITTPASPSYPPTNTTIPSFHRSRKRAPTTTSLPLDPDSPVSPKSFPRTTPSKATPPMSDDMDVVNDNDSDNKSSPASSSSSPSSNNSSGGGSSSSNDSPSPSHPTSTSTSSHHRLPIALLPAYQLTHTDAFACSVDIADRYSPLDHWQWGATVWRGVVGADITVAVKVDVENAPPPPPPPPPLSALPTSGGSGGGTSGSGSGRARGGEEAGREEGGEGDSPVFLKSEAAAVKERDRERERPGTAGGKVGGGAPSPHHRHYPQQQQPQHYPHHPQHPRHQNGPAAGSSSGSGVEVRLDDCRAVIVKADPHQQYQYQHGMDNHNHNHSGSGSGSGGIGNGGIPEGSLRRVGFEVGEWVRGWAERERGREREREKGEE